MSIDLSEARPERDLNGYGKWTLGGFRLRLFLNPLNQSDLRPAVQAKWEERPPQPSIDIQLGSAGLVPTRHATITSRRKPEGRYSRHPPLSAMTVSAEDQVNGMMGFHIVEDVGGMGQQQRKARPGARRDASKIRTMKRRIIDADDHQFSLSR